MLDRMWCWLKWSSPTLVVCCSLVPALERLGPLSSPSLNQSSGRSTTHTQQLSPGWDITLYGIVVVLYIHVAHACMYVSFICLSLVSYFVRTSSFTHSTIRILVRFTKVPSYSFLTLKLNTIPFQMRISYDDQFLFSVGQDGSLLALRVTDKDGRGLKREKDITFAEEVLVMKTDLEEKVGKWKLLYYLVLTAYHHYNMHFNPIIHVYQHYVQQLPTDLSLTYMHQKFPPAVYIENLLFVHSIIISCDTIS